MEIINVIPRGFCKGVVRAIEIAKRTAAQYPNTKITILGELVHNRFVVESLKEAGIDTLEDKSLSRLELLERIDTGVVIFSAHGIGDDVVARAKQKGLIIVDASCEDVVHTQRLIKSYLEQDYEILYIGQNGHPESQAVLSIDPVHIHLIKAIEDLSAIPLKDKIFITNQTTMSQYDIRTLMDAILLRFPHSVVSDEICNATRLRQEAVMQLDNVDCLLVVGDIRSNNTAMLAKIARSKGIPHVYRIESAADLPIDEIKGLARVAVTAGASTPFHLIQQVLDVLEKINSQIN
jgi:4-hydroxy-3-methylbut-2-enyl diphosphate reductase